MIRYLSQRMKESMGLCDLITGEKSIQAFLNVYLGLSQLYIIHTEKEMNKGFTARYREMKYAYILEIKYIKTSDNNKKLESIVKQAQVQLKKYSLDRKFKKILSI